MRQALLSLYVALVLAFLSANVKADTDLVLGVSEGTSGGLNHASAVLKYEGLADLLGKAIRRKVSVTFVREFAQLEDGMKTGRLDFVMARPSDYPATGIRDYGYQFVASAKPEGHCLIIVPKGSPVKSLADIGGKRWVLPETSAYMTRFCKAALRDLGVRVHTAQLKHVREQAAVAFFLEHGFSDIGGVASYSGVGRTWEAQGHRILHRSAAQPYFPLIAGPRVSASDVAAIQKQLAGLPESSAGQGLLKTIGVKAFDVSSKDRLAALLAWLNKDHD